MCKKLSLWDYIQRTFPNEQKNKRTQADTLRKKVKHRKFIDKNVESSVRSCRQNWLCYPSI